MLIQPINNQPQAMQPAIQPGSDVPKAADTSNVVATQSVTQSNTQTTTQQPTPAQLKEAIKVINQAFQQSNQSLEFSVDSATKTPIVKLTDTSTGEVIRQFPTQQTLAISQSIDQYQHGLLLTQKA
ncbi:MAG: flagellar protein FlaG [Gallionella sp.]|jgi:flagellar protein FlaG